MNNKKLKYLNTYITDYKVIDYNQQSKKYILECQYCHICLEKTSTAIKRIIDNNLHCNCITSGIKPGNKYGKLTVLYRDLTNNKKGTYWICQCDCGNLTSVYTSSLKNGNTQSCGCMNKIGLQKWNLQQSENTKIPLGSKFGKLTVIEDLGFREQVPGHNRRWYKCQCDCGNTHEVMGNMLKQGQVISCGKCLCSKGEYIISQLLDTNNIIYNHDIQIPELTTQCGKRLRFDFIIYEDNKISRIIEFDGRQHITGPDTNYWGHSTDTLEAIQEKDNIKNQWCINHNIPLVRIPYTKINNITFEDLFGDKYLIKGDD